MLDLLLLRHGLLQMGRIAFALLLLALLWAIGRVVLRAVRVSIADRTERVLIEVGAGFAVYQFLVRWLAELPIVSPIGMVSIVAILAIATGAIAGRTMFTDVRDALARPIAYDWRGVAILLLVLPPLAMALAPAVSRDAMIYHLRFPEMTLHAGRWAYDPPNDASYNPAATGTLYLATLAVDPSGVAAQLVHYGFFLLSILTAAALARRMGAATGRNAAVLLAALPLVAIVAGWSWAELSLLFAIEVSALALFSGRLEIATMFLGLAASTKYIALLAAAPIAVAALVVAIRAKAFRRLAGGIVLAILVSSPWYVTNVMRTGNPVYPLASSLFGGRQYPLEKVTTWSREPGDSWFDVWRNYFLAPQTLDADPGGILLLLILLLGTAIAFRRGSPRSLKLGALTMLALWLPFLPLTTAIRYLIPAVTGGMIVAGAALERFPNRWTAALVALFALRGGMVTAAHNAHFRNALPAAVGIEPEEAYIRRNFPPASLYERAAKELPADARVLAINETRLFRFPRPVTVSRVYDPPLLERYVSGAGNLDEVVRRLHRDGITHLLVTPKPVERGGGPQLDPRGAKLVTVLARASKVVDRQGELYLLRLP